MDFTTLSSLTHSPLEYIFFFGTARLIMSVVFHSSSIDQH
jgi:hypothetical protein